MRIPHELLFGKGFYQDYNEIRIQKSSLSRLNPVANNSAQSILAALLLQALGTFHGYLENEKGEILQLDTGEPIEFDNSALYERLNLSLWRVFPQIKYGVPVITHTFLIQIYASDLIPYEQPIQPSDLET